jgi:hypothetical protein
MADPRRLKRAAVGGWLAGCCALAVSLVLSAQAFAAVTVTVATSDGFQGGTLTLTVGLNRMAADPAIAGTQIDIVFDASQIQLAGTCSNGGATCQEDKDCGDGTCNLSSCVKDPRLTHQGFSAGLPSTVRPPDPAGHHRLRLAVFGDVQNPATTPTFDSGNLATCTFQVPVTAEPNKVVALTTDRVVVTDSNDDQLSGVIVQVTPGKILPAPATPTVTPTPFSCFVDKDCPRGQVCGPDKLCRPAPTPTPTIHCEQDQDCPDGLKCVSNVCRDLSTPTPTPTPLPTCTTDQDCINLEGPGFHCRAGVCVPVRQCDDSNAEIDRKACRGDPGIDEACVDHVCECGGDCDLDGLVLGTEITRMICISKEQPELNCPLSACPAGDINGDNHVTGNEICRAVAHLGQGCPAEGQPLEFGLDRTSEVRSLDIGSASGAPGETVTVTLSLSCPSPGCPAATGGADVATAQLDVVFDRTLVDIADPSHPEAACTLDPRLLASDAAYAYSPQPPGSSDQMTHLRLFVADLNICKDGLTFPASKFDEGQLLSCTFRISPLAPQGDIPLKGERLNVGDPLGDEFGAASTAGKVTVTAPSTCTTDSDCKTGETHCRAGLCKGIRPCSGPTAGPSECLSGREACIAEGSGRVCECAADCNLDGRVRNDEVTTLVNLFHDPTELSSCVEVDINGDSLVRNNEVTAATLNFLQGCP